MKKKNPTPKKWKIKPRKRNLQKRAGGWHMSQNHFVFLAAEWESGYMHMVLMEVWTQISSCHEQGLSGLNWAHLSFLSPFLWRVHWSALVHRWADRPGWPEQCSWVFRCWQSPAVIPARCECSGCATMGHRLQLCWDGKCSMGVTAQGPPQLLEGSWAEFVAA